MKINKNLTSKDITAILQQYEYLENKSCSCNDDDDEIINGDLLISRYCYELANKLGIDKTRVLNSCRKLLNEMDDIYEQIR